MPSAFSDFLGSLTGVTEQDFQTGDSSRKGATSSAQDVNEHFVLF